MFVYVYILYPSAQPQRDLYPVAMQSPGLTYVRSPPSPAPHVPLTATLTVTLNPTLSANMNP